MAKTPASDAMKDLPSMEAADPAPEAAPAPEAPAVAPAAAPAAAPPAAGPTPGSGLPVWVDAAVAQPGGVWKVPGTEVTIRTN